MKKHILKIIYGVLLLIFFILASFLLLLIVREKLYYDIVVLILLVLMIMMFAYLLILECIGKKEYIFDNLALYAKRKDKILYKYYKEKIHDLIKVVDVVTEDLYLIVFKYEGKKRKIRVTKKNEDSINLFIKELPFSIKKNYIYYLFAFFIQR